MDRLKRIFIVGIVGFLFVARVFAATPAARFENLSLKDFIKFISYRTNLNIIYSPNIIPSSIKVSLYSSESLTNKDLLKIFYSVLKENRLVAIKEGKTILIVRAPYARNVGSNFESSLEATPDVLSTTILRLKNFKVDRLLVPIRHMMSPFGSVDVIPQLNIVVLTDTVDRIKQVVKLLKKIDSSQRLETRLIPLKNVSSSSVANQLNRLFTELQRKKGVAYSPIILSDDSINSLIVAAKKSDFDFINSLVDEIVKRAESQRAQKVFYLKNAVAKDVYDVIVKLLGKQPAFKNTTISYDTSTNSIIVIGNPSTYDRISSLIKKLDVPRKQVFIEALIIETTLNKLSEFGVEWSAVAKKGGAIGYTGSSNTGNLGNLETSIVGNGKLTALPGGFSLGVLGNVVTYNGVKFPTIGALLNALKSNSDVNIVSNPEIVTLDNQKAMIFVGENRPYLTSQKYDSNGNPIYTYDYKDVGVKLSILPHVNGSEIILDTSLEVKKVSENVMVGNSVAPVTLTRQTTTKIALKNGEKILISGLIENDTVKQHQAVPLLSDIPILGGLFQYTKKSSAKTNLVIFLSVHTINKFRGSLPAKSSLSVDNNTTAKPKMGVVKRSKN